ncbi:MAG: YraN family protein [Defluviitaleaceae bacterium]|nr:YraN family protein [Defluviitaleaceae bacterium]
MDRRKTAGNYGETVAAGYLEGKGYTILARNHRAYGGEIDIVAKNGEYIVFVEVKFRKQLDYGRPMEAVSRKKQKSIIAAAYGYIARNCNGNEYCRFDVIEIFGREQMAINHIENAFGES